MRGRAAVLKEKPRRIHHFGITVETEVEGEVLGLERFRFKAEDDSVGCLEAECLAWSRSKFENQLVIYYENNI